MLAVTFPLPRVEPNYCRARSNCQYLDLALNQQTKDVQERGRGREREREHNLAFHNPKSDRSNRCECHKVASIQEKITQHMEEGHSEHLLEEENTRDEQNNLEGEFDLGFWNVLFKTIRLLKIVSHGVTVVFPTVVFPTVDIMSLCML